MYLYCIVIANVISLKYQQLNTVARSMFYGVRFIGDTCGEL